MTRPWRNLIRAAAVAALLAGCSTPSEGGGGFEGEALSLAGTVRFSGRVLQGASVSFLDLRSENVMGGAVTDSAGSFRMAVPSGRAGFVEVRSGDSALCRRFVGVAPEQTLALDAVAPSSWTARAVLGGRPLAGASIRIAGSPATSKTDGAGRFSLLRLGREIEWILVDLPDGTRRELRLPPVSDTVLDVPARPGLLLDDFEGTDGRSALGHVLGSGEWYALTDAINGGSSVALPSGVTSDISKAITTIDAYSGRSLSIQFQIDPTQFYHYAQAIVNLSDSGWWTDLSRVDSISLMAKGTGKVRIEFTVRMSMEPDWDPNGRFGAEFALPSTWTRIVVRKADIVAPSGSRPAIQGVPWSTASVQTRSIIFMATDAASIQLDEIFLHGPRLSDLAPHR